MRTGFPRGLVLGLLLLVAGSGAVLAQSENLPPKPATYFTDQAGVVDAGTAATINSQLDQFERETSNQILVAIYPSLPDGAAVDQYSIDAFNSWQVGQKEKNNGVVLFVFVKDHKMFICTGRGLEGALPDAICKDIVRDVITPSFRQGNYAAGIQAGVNAMIAATKGEYKGNGLTVADQQQDSGGSGFPAWVVILFIILIVATRLLGFGFGVGPMIFTGGGFGGGGFGGGGFGGGGGFSGGGGCSAGGGAGGGW